MFETMRHWVLALALVVPLIAPSWVSAKCALPSLEPQVLAHPADPVPSGAGILVGWQTRRGGDHETRDPAANPRWRLSSRKTRLAPALVRLAPGLAVYRLPSNKRARPGAYTLLDARGAALGRFTFARTKLAAPMEAPTVAAVTTSTTKRGRWQAASTVVSLASPPPTEAYALVVRLAGGDALTWGLVGAGGDTSVLVFEDDGRCEVHPEGMRAPQPGEAVEAFWVDRFGRVGASSGVVTTAS